MPQRTLWVDTLLADNTAANGQTINQLTSEFLATDLRLARMTLLRTIIRYDLAATVRDSGEGDQVVDVGICVVPAEATAAPPDPDVATDHPTLGWIWRARYRVYAVAVDDQNLDVIRIDLDIRARRKLANGRVVMVTDNNDNQGVSTSVTNTGLIRQLWLVT